MGFRRWTKGFSGMCDPHHVYNEFTSLVVSTHWFFYPDIPYLGLLDTSQRAASRLQAFVMFVLRFVDHGVGRFGARALSWVTCVVHGRALLCSHLGCSSSCYVRLPRSTE